MNTTENSELRRLKYNDLEGRKALTHLTADEEEKAIRTMDKFMEQATAEEVLLIQKFINQLQELEHYETHTTGLYCTDMPDLVLDPLKIMFELGAEADPNYEYGKLSKEPDEVILPLPDRKEVSLRDLRDYFTHFYKKEQEGNEEQEDQQEKDAA